MSDDLISRQAAIDALNRLCPYPGEWSVNGLDLCKDAIANLPSIDAVQVVQCKDCLFNDGDGPNEDDKYWCALHQSFMQYCSEAERKKETCNNKTGNLQ